MGRCFRSFSSSRESGDEKRPSPYMNAPGRQLRTCAALGALLRPTVRYSKSHGTRLLLGESSWWKSLEVALPIEDLRAKRRIPPIPPKTKRPADIALWRFAALANRSSLHPRDWEHFYGFISVAAQHRVGWDHHDVARRLTECGFSEELAKELGEIYWHCRCVLFVRGRHYSFGSYEYGKWLSKRGIALT